MYANRSQTQLVRVARHLPCCAQLLQPDEHRTVGCCDFFRTNISQCFAYLKNILPRLEIREFYVDLQNVDYQLFLKN